MKLEKFALMVVLPVLVFLLYSVDVNAEETSYTLTVQNNYGYQESYDITCTYKIAYYAENGILKCLGIKDNGVITDSIPATVVKTVTIMSTGQIVGTSTESTLPWYYTKDLKYYTTTIPLFDTQAHARAYLSDGDTSGWLNKSSIINDLTGEFDKDGYMPNGYVYDELIGYIQNVVYTEVKGEAGQVNSRVSRIEWSTEKDLPEGAYVEIYARNFWTKWINKTTEGTSIYKSIKDRCMYSDGNAEFGFLAAVKAWAEEQDIDLTSLSTQAYGTTDYLIRIAVYDEDTDTVRVGGWVRVDVKRGTSSEVPTATSTTVEIDSETGDIITDRTSLDSYSYDTDQSGHIVETEKGFFDSLESFYETLKGMSGTISGVAGFFAAVCGWLPQWCTYLIGAALAVVVVLRFIGR